MIKNFLPNYKEVIKNKKFLPYFVLGIIGLLVTGILIYFAIQKEWLKPSEKPSAPAQKTLEDTLKDLTAPEGVGVEIPKDVLKKLSAPEGKLHVSEDVLQNLTAPQ